MGVIMARLATFLLVDDDPIFLAAAESIVASPGESSITTAANAAVGLEALCHAPSPFNFIVLDLNTTGLSAHLSTVKG
jgi:CheY-like chemotaxis protein